MLAKFWEAAGLFVVLVSFPLFAWLGAVLIREGRPLAQWVFRRFRLLAIGLLVANVVFGQFDQGQRFTWATFGFLISAYLLAMLFVPMLRRLQRSTEENSPSGRRAQQ